MDNDQFQRFMDAFTQNAPGRKCPEVSSVDPDDWRTFRARFENVVALNHWNAERARRELKIAITGPLAALLRDVTFVPDPVPAAGVPDVADLLDLIQNRLMPAADSDMVRISIMQAMQEEGESTQAWQARIRMLFKRGNPQVADDDLDGNRQLLDRFILGLKNQEVKQRTWESRPATLQAATNFALNVEAGQKILGMGGAASLHAVTPKDQCYYCDKPGHLIRDCRALKRDKVGRGRGAARGGGGRGGGGRGRGAPRGSRGFSRGAKRGFFKPGRGRATNPVHAVAALHSAEGAETAGEADNSISSEPGLPDQQGGGGQEQEDWPQDFLAGSAYSEPSKNL